MPLRRLIAVVAAVLAAAAFSYPNIVSADGPDSVGIGAVNSVEGEAPSASTSLELQNFSDRISDAKSAGTPASPVNRASADVAAPKSSGSDTGQAAKQVVAVSEKSVREAGSSEAPRTRVDDTATPNTSAVKTNVPKSGQTIESTAATASAAIEVVPDVLTNKANEPDAAVAGATNNAGTTAADAADPAMGAAENAGPANEAIDTGEAVAQEAATAAIDAANDALDTAEAVTQKTVVDVVQDGQPAPKDAVAVAVDIVGAALGSGETDLHSVIVRLGSVTDAPSIDHLATQLVVMLDSVGTAADDVAAQQSGLALALETSGTTFIADDLPPAPAGTPAPETRFPVAADTPPSTPAAVPEDPIQPESGERARTETGAENDPELAIVDPAPATTSSREPDLQDTDLPPAVRDSHEEGEVTFPRPTQPADPPEGTEAAAPSNAPPVPGKLKSPAAWAAVFLALAGALGIQLIGRSARLPDDVIAAVPVPPG
ncbi:MAG: hypothetical protein HY682_03555 [Chloroflexi bacterium]|nr:hypothetical protein [Chloroflexota bacterium]